MWPKNQKKGVRERAQSYVLDPKFTTPKHYWVFQNLHIRKKKYSQWSLSILLRNNEGSNFNNLQTVPCTLQSPYHCLHPEAFVALLVLLPPLGMLKTGLISDTACDQTCRYKQHVRQKYFSEDPTDLTSISLSFRGWASIRSCEVHRSVSLDAPLTGVTIVAWKWKEKKIVTKGQSLSPELLKVLTCFLKHFLR